MRALLIIALLAGPAAADAGRRKKSRPKPPPNPVTSPAAPSEPVEVLFTFDDGPHLQLTPRVLAELDKRHMKAIFFVNGWHFDKDERARALLRDEIARGHYVGNHTYSHRILCKHIPDAPREIDHNEDLIEQVLGYRPSLLRTPYGQHCAPLVRIVSQRGYDLIGWDIDAQEWKPGSRPDRVASFIISHIAQLKKRGIVLLHDTHLATVQALPTIFDWLAKHPEIKVVAPKVLLRPGAPVPPAPQASTPAALRSP